MTADRRGGVAGPLLAAGERGFSARPPIMNRRERRAAEAAARKQNEGGGLEPVVAFHEAGHAIARYLTAAELGYAPDEAIARIEIASGPLRPLGDSFDGKATTYSQAVTFGPKLSKAMDATARPILMRVAGQTISGKAHFDLMVEIVAAARAAGADIDAWLRARALICIFGSIAEALYTRKPFEEIWNGYEAENDMRNIVGDCMIAGMGDAAEAIIDAAVERAKVEVARPGMLDALNALSRHLHDHGTTKGRLAVSIIERHLPRD